MPAQLVQCDEIWAFCYAKRKNVDRAMAAPEGAGDVWTWTAIDSVSKLMLSWYVSNSRDGETALAFMDDLRSRTTDKFQLTTDGLAAYPEAVEGAFGGNVDFGQLIKLYAPARGSPPLLSLRVRGNTAKRGDRRPRQAVYQHIPRRAAQLDHANEYAPVHPIDQRFQQES